MKRIYWERFFEGNRLATRARILLQESAEAYLVGGSVRDALLGRESHDLDFVVPSSSALETGRRVADALGGSYYPLDAQRGFARVVVACADDDGDGNPVFLDISPLGGATLSDDLAARDFTMNAMAVRLSDLALFDPFAGQSDLAAHRLRLVSSGGIANDPIRAVRAVRLAAEFGLTMEPETRRLVVQDGRGLAVISPERIRDELLKILGLPAAAQPLGALAELDLMPWILPEMMATCGCVQSAPHRLDVWEHSLLTVTRLEAFLAHIQRPEEGSPGAQAMSFLDEFRPALCRHMQMPLSDHRPRWVILKLAALLHDVGKPECRQIDATGRVRFLGHEGRSAEITQVAARRLRLSLSEIELVRAVVGRHMGPMCLAATSQVTVRAAHRYTRELGRASADVALLALADTWAQEPGPDVSPARERIAATVVALLRHALSDDSPESSPRLLSGSDIMYLCGMPPGRDVGHWLRELREAQVAGEFQDRAGAIRWLQAAWNNAHEKEEEGNPT